MADLNEIKDINADLQLTKFPNEIDDYEPFSDANDEINSAIVNYKNLLKQGETGKAEEIYERYSLKKYIVSAYFLNKIQHMIIACERAISSVKKYFTFSVEQPTSTSVQPNGYIWGKILEAGNDFKKVIFKLKENNRYMDIYPLTTSDNVLISEDDTETVKDNLDTLNTHIKTKMDKSNPTGTGSLAMNLGNASIGGEGFNSVSLGTNNTSVGKNSVALGYKCQALTNNSIVAGNNLTANVADQLVTGRYNTASDTNYAHIIGGGTANDRKNIYTVDWDGNVKGNSFTAKGDIIFDDGKSLKSLSETVRRDVAENTSQIAAFNNGIMTLNNSNSFVIKAVTSGHYDTSETVGNVKAGEIITFNIVSDMNVNDNLILIPYYSSQYTNADLRMFSSNTATRVIGPSKTITVTASLQNISSSDHNLIVYWYAIVYTNLTIS